MRGLTGIIRDHHRIILPTNMSRLLKVLVMLEGTSRSLDRDFNLVELLKPYQAGLWRQKFSLERLLHRLQRTYREWDRLLDMLPGQLTDTLQHVRDGRFNIYLEHRRNAISCYIPYRDQPIKAASRQIYPSNQSHFDNQD